MRGSYLQSSFHKITIISSEHPTDIPGSAVPCASRNLICDQIAGCTKTSAAPKLPQLRDLLVWLPLKSGMAYLTLYDLATLLHHLGRT